MRHGAVREFVILLFAWSFLALPLHWDALGGPAKQSCSCPMCRTIGGGAHCECCEAGKCNCHMTTGKDYPEVVLVVEPAVLPDPGAYVVILPSVAFDLPAPHKTPIPDLIIPTPPPKG